MFFGKELFSVGDDGKLRLEFAPVIPAYLIDKNNQIEAAFLGNIKAVYHFSEKRDYYPGNYRISRICLRYRGDEGEKQIDGQALCGAQAEDILNGLVEEIQIYI